MTQSNVQEPRPAKAKREETVVKPAASVWTDPMPAARDEQIAFFKREGFLILPGTVDDGQMAELHDELQRFVEHPDNLPRVREGVMLEPVQDEKRSTRTLRKLGGITAFSEPFVDVMRHPRILDMLHAVMGPTIELYRDVVMMKPARVGRQKPWHQDSSYWPWEPMDLISAMTALDDATPENGCLQIIPRTHTTQVQHFGQELQVEIDDAMQARTYYVPLKRGDTLLFHSLLLHASEPNDSDDDRRVCIFSYKTPKLRYIGKEGGERTSILVHDVRHDG